MTFKLATSLGS